MIKDENYVLSNGIKIPKIAFGTWQIVDGKDAYTSVMYALKAGYRHIDTAAAYENEASVGKAIQDFGIDRKDIFITTKLPAEIKNVEEALHSFEKSLAYLKTDYIDLYLIHAPWPWNNVGQDCTKENIELWKLLVQLYHEGKIKAIGVSNFLETDIKPLYDATGFYPQVNQIRYFIGNIQKDLTDYCQRKDILIEAYSPLATGLLLNHPEIEKIAQKYNTTIPKICLRYCIEKNTLPIPKSVHENRIIDNLDIDFKMSEEDIAYLDTIEEDDSLKRPLRS